MSLKLLLPLILAVFFYISLCGYTLFKSQRTRHFSKWVWLIICVVSMPLGGLLYFVYGKEREEEK